MLSSVILPSKNRWNEVKTFVTSLYAQDYEKIELILVDSSEPKYIENLDFKEFFYKYQAKYKFKYIQSNPGLTLQKNNGVSEASGDMLFFFDDDIVLDENFITSMVNIFKTKPEYMGGMGRICNEKRKNTFGRKIYYLFLRLFALPGGKNDGSFTSSGFPNMPHDNDLFFESMAIAGGVTAFRKEVFYFYKFDESLTGYSYLEDADFSYRVSRKFKLFYNPEAKCEHHHKNSKRDDLMILRKMYLINFVFFFFKNIYKNSKLNIVHCLRSIIGLYIESFINFLINPKEGYMIIKGYNKAMFELLLKKNK